MSDEPALWGEDLFGNPIKPPSRGVVSDRFLFPPFTILDARKGAWQERKRAWIGLGIRSELGRDRSLVHQIPFSTYDGENMEEEYYGDEVQGGNTSIFDPVLCELFYRWFVPDGGLVLDPYAGGSVRGVVASELGHRYYGIELRREQVEANREQAREMDLDPAPVWKVGDARDRLPKAPDADAIWTCPPYGDLEVYSDDPRDLSQMDAEAFVEAYREIAAAAVDRLLPDSFAGIVVGDYRDGEGFYRDFIGTTVRAFEDAGARLYNRAVLVLMVGSASMRANRQFSAGRKLVKTHQTVLIFAKGDPMEAARLCERDEDDEDSARGNGAQPPDAGPDLFEGAP